MYRKLIAAMIPALLLAGPALAQTPGPKSGERADIPFIDHGGIRNFEPARDGNGVYLQDSRKNWYYASFFTRCHELPYALAVAFKTWGPSLTRGDSVLVRGERCAIADLVRSGPPPAKPKKDKPAKQPAGA